MGGGISRGGEEGIDDGKGRKGVVGEVIEWVRQDLELDEYNQRVLGCIINLCNSDPLLKYFSDLQGMYAEHERKYSEQCYPTP